MKRWSTIGIALLVTAVAASASDFDIRTALDKSINGFVPTPNVWSVSAHTQGGDDGFWYRWDNSGNPRINWWEVGAASALTLNAGGPTAYPLLGYAANDTRGYEHGWVYQASTGAPGYVGNITYDESDANLQAGEVNLQYTNTSQDGGYPPIVEWKATSAGEYNTDFTLREIGTAAIWQAHLLTWDASASTWGNQKYHIQLGTGSQAMSFDSAVSLDAGDSIVLYLTAVDTDDAGGGGGGGRPYLSGGVNVIPEPATFGLLGLAGVAMLLRRRRG